MDTSLLDTKHFGPALRIRRVARPRLYGRLAPLLDRKLGLVSAPAGCGKTTLVADWLDHLTQRRDIVAPDVAWLAVDAADNEPLVFFADLYAALYQVYPFIGRTMQAILGADASVPIEPLIVALINQIASAPTECVCVLDDYQLIENLAIHGILDFFIDHLPPQLHLLICTRSDPPLALDRLRVRGNLVEIRQHHLAFAVGEADAFFEHTMGIDLSQKQVAALTARTEGWVAGLQLAALSLREAETTSRDRLVAAFSGSHSNVSSYLLNEAFSRQTSSVQSFLLHTSFVDQFCASLCNALVGDQDIAGREMLDLLDAGQVFLVPLDGERQWYRYHHLFRSFLRDHLTRHHPALIPELHLRASHWYEAQGLVREAIDHALSGNSPDRATTLIDKMGFRISQEQSNTRLLQWIAHIPTTLHREHPWLRVAQLNALCGMECYNELLPLIESLAADVDLYPEHPIGACVTLTRAWCAMRTRYAPHELLSYGLQAQQQLASQPDSNDILLLRALAEMYIGHGHWNAGDRSEARAAFENMLRLCQAAHSVPAKLQALVQLALFYQAVGPFRRCAEVCEQGIEMAEQAWSERSNPAPPAERVATLEGLLALMLLLSHRLEEAEIHARRSVELYELGGSRPGHLIEMGLLNLAWVHCARDQHHKAYAILRRIDRILLGCDQHVVKQVQPKLVRLRIALARRRSEWHYLLRDVESWVGQARLDPDHPEHNSVRDYEALGCGLMAMECPAEAIPWLERGMEKTRAQGWVLSEMLFAMWLSIAHEQAGNEQQAMEAMARALAMAEPESCLAIFAELGPVALAIVRRIRATLPRSSPPYRNITPRFVDAVLAAFPADIAATPEPAPILAKGGLVEPLSERETEVLQLLARGLRNQEIANALYVTTNTVSFHLKNVYGKLDVHSRTGAVAAARELALLP